MNKKRYFTPAIEVVNIALSDFLAVSSEKMESATKIKVSSSIPKGTGTFWAESSFVNSSPIP